MKQFTGFPARAKYTPLPNIFFSSLLSQITDIIELKVTLHVFETLYPKRGYPKFVTFHELLNNLSLLKSLDNSIVPPADAIHKALELAVNRGTLLYLAVNGDKTSEDIYFLNTEADRQIIEKIRRGELQLSGFEPTIPPVTPDTELPNIFEMYEENIGMLTPLIADELREAEKTYPAEWLREAIKEAVSLNKRNWRYISRILEHWTTEGKNDNGTHRRYIKENTDPDKYIRGKYGHIVQR
jgi:DNA replication protein